ncbi:MAG: thioredoxin-dependent thiol peroxidase [Candidatus Nitrosocosmicus sp.]|jgi:peroxiredoxin Q/BCP|uniref:thioredoxin-dependent thiol peroxidase n=1 Tax=Candidatus Nitrosocosmicus sp. FF01 TaxID=3397670 RepID=UPI002A6FAFD5|nr:thioredoxin-dependent thiol peroxidase [Candidatus Nitrosocosmicus sp.]
MEEENKLRTDGRNVKEGDKPFDFEFQDIQGKTSKLSDLIGEKKIIVYFYPKDFTPGCTIEAEEFSRDYDQFRTDNIEIIGISPDTEESHVKFREKMKIPYMLASDIHNNISKNFGVFGLKKFMGKEYYGVNRSTFLIDTSGKIVKIYDKVKPKGHSKEVLEYFKSVNN